MPDPDAGADAGGHLLDGADWAIVSSGLLRTDPPLVVEALTFTVADYLQPLFELLSASEGQDAEVLGQLVEEAAGVELASVGATTILRPASPGELAARVEPLVADLLVAAGLEDDGRLAAELAALRLPVFGSQPRDTRPLREWAEGAGSVLMCVGVLAGTHAPALLLLAGPAGAIITIGTYAGLGGAWAAGRIRRRRDALREAKPPGAAPQVDAPSAGHAPSPEAVAAQRRMAAQRQEALRGLPQTRIRIRPREG